MQTWEQTLDFPAGIRIGGVQITALNATGVRTSPYSFRQEAQVFSGQTMRMRVDFLPHDPEAGSRLEAFLLSLRGGAGVFRFGDPYHSSPMGQALGWPTVASAVAGAQTLETRGWFGKVPRQLLAGDYIQIGERLHRVLGDVASGEDGAATLGIWPNLRESYPEGTPVILANPTGLWRLAHSGITYSRRPAGQRHITSMECAEAL